MRSVHLVFGLILIGLVGCGGGDSKPAPKAADEKLAPTEPRKQAQDDGKKKADDPKSDGAPKPMPSDPGTISIPLAIRNLTSDDAAERLEAVNVLANAEYDPEIGEQVSAGLIRRLADVERGTRDSAVIALKKWARSDDVEAIAAMLSRGDEDIRHRAIAVLAHLKTPEAAEHVAMRLTSAFDRKEAKVALLDMGPIVEMILLETYIEDPDAEVRLAVVEVLQEVGGGASIEPLAELQEDTDPKVATAAARALMQIEGR